MTKTKRTVSKVEAEVKPIGNTAHVTVPKEWIGKTVVVTPK
jgi:putative transposon-encoded protein